MKQLLFALLLCIPTVMLAQKKAAPLAGFTVEAIVCVGDTVEFTNTANTSNVHYDFADGTDTRKENPRHIFKEGGSYLVVQTAYADGTSATFEFTIEVKEAPTITLSYTRDAVNDTVSMFIGQNVTVTIQESYDEYNWYRELSGKWARVAEGDPSYSTNTNGDYKLWVKNSDGCANEAPFWILTRERPADDDLINIIVENNVLTPNSDGINDVLFVKDLGNPDIYTNPLKIYIYNKAGTLIFQDENYANNWSGVNSSGTELPTGTYYFVATSQDRRGKTGYIDIIRSE